MARYSTYKKHPAIAVILPKHWLAYWLQEGGKTLIDVVDWVEQKYGVKTSKQNISLIAKKYGIDLKRRSPRWYAKHRGASLLENPKWLLEQLEKGDVGLRKIAYRSKVSYDFLVDQITRLGLDPAQWIRGKRPVIRVRCAYCGKLLERPFWRQQGKKHAFCDNKEKGRWLSGRKKT